jgi:hypothetical protein
MHPPPHTLQCSLSPRILAHGWQIWIRRQAAVQGYFPDPADARFTPALLPEEPRAAKVAEESAALHTALELLRTENDRLKAVATPRAQADAAASRHAHADGGLGPLHSGGPVVQPRR